MHALHILNRVSIGAEVLGEDSALCFPCQGVDKALFQEK